MELLKDLANAISANWAGLLEAVAYVVLAASAVIKIFPTLDKNNRILPFIKWVGKYLALEKYAPSDEDRPTKD